VAAPLTETATVIPRGRDDKPNAWLNRFAWLTCVATLLLICSGGMVTSKGVGLAVPDWPTTFGYNMFLFPVSKWVGGILFEHTHRLWASMVGLLVVVLTRWLGGYTSRRPLAIVGALETLAGLLIFALWPDQKATGGFLTGIGAVVLLAALVWVQNQASSRPLPQLGWLVFALVQLQGLLGGLRVTMLKDEIGVFHACVAQAFLGLLVFIALATTSFWRSFGVRGHVRAFANGDMSPQAKIALLKMLAVAITTTIYVQLALGATMRHQHRDLSILDFPTANGAWLPDTSAAALAKINAWREAHALSDVTAFQIWLQMGHRFLALAIAIAIIVFSLRVFRSARTRPRFESGDMSPHSKVPAPASTPFHWLRRLSIWWAIFLFLQITLGAWTIWSNKAADVATAHVAMGALMLSFGVMISAICWRVVAVSRQQARGGSEPDRRSALPISA
jgi:cytochrome c oxidase assembly protein subunit 15